MKLYKIGNQHIALDLIASFDNLRGDHMSSLFEVNLLFCTAPIDVWFRINNETTQDFKQRVQNEYDAFVKAVQEHKRDIQFVSDIKQS